MARVAGPAVGPRVRRLLIVVMVLAAALAANSIYLAAHHLPRIGDRATAAELLLPVHVPRPSRARAAHRRSLFAVRGLSFRGGTAAQEPDGVATGYALGGASLALLATGLILLHVSAGSRSAIRAGVPWRIGCTAALPIASATLYVWHRERGGRFRAGRAWASFAAVAALSVALACVHALNPRPKSGVPHEGDRFFSPSLVRTQEGRLLPLRSLTMNEYCKSCHADAIRDGCQRAPLQLVQQPGLPASVKETRKVVLKAGRRRRRGSRWCAGCHDPVPLSSSGTFDAASTSRIRTTSRPARPASPARVLPRHHDGEQHAGQRRLHHRAPQHYPFAFSTSPVLQCAEPTTHQGQAGLPQGHLSQAAAPHRGVLLDLPQGPHSVRGEQVQGVPARPEPLRRLPAERRVGPRRPQLLLSAAGREASLRRLPHAARHVARTSAPGPSTRRGALQHPRPPASRRPTRASPFLRGDRRDDDAAAGHFWTRSRRVDIFGVREGGTRSTGELLGAASTAGAPALAAGRDATCARRWSAR